MSKLHPNIIHRLRHFSRAIVALAIAFAFVAVSNLIPAEGVGFHVHFIRAIFYVAGVVCVVVFIDQILTALER